MANDGYNHGILWQYWDIKDMYFIKPRYGSIKEELLNNVYMDVRRWHRIEIKANAWRQTIRCRMMTARNFRQAKDYGIDKGSLMTTPHLIAISAYTDYTNVAADFANSYRQSPTESFDHVKEKNTKYANMGRLLLEVVNCWGANGMMGDMLDGGITKFDLKIMLKNASKELTVYRGLSRAMPVSRIITSHNAPSSYSNQIEVALKFAGPSGMIMEADPKYDTGTRYFDASWISNYTEESEYLFFGPDRICYVKFRIVESNTSYQMVPRHLRLFDAILSRQKFGAIVSKANLEEIKMLCNIMQVSSREYKRLDVYGQQLIMGFTKQRSEIFLDFPQLKKNGGECERFIAQPFVHLPEEERKQFENVETMDILKLGWISLQKLILVCDDELPLKIEELLRYLAKMQHLYELKTIIKAPRRNKISCLTGIWKKWQIEYEKKYGITFEFFPRRINLKQFDLQKEKWMNTALGTNDFLVLTKSIQSL